MKLKKVVENNSDVSSCNISDLSSFNSSDNEGEIVADDYKEDKKKNNKK